MSDWLNERFVSLPFIFFFFFLNQWWRYAAGLVGCPVKQFFFCFVGRERLKMLNGIGLRGLIYVLRYTSGQRYFWMPTLTEEGKPGGTFRIFFGCDSERKKTQWHHVTMQKKKKIWLMAKQNQHWWYWCPVLWPLNNVTSKSIIVIYVIQRLLTENSQLFHFHYVSQIGIPVCTPGSRNNDILSYIAYK